MSLIIEEITIKNFRSHSNTNISFKKGINLISGRNGSGKTSILEAILVALYGPRPTGVRKDDLIKIGSQHYSISLKFLLNGEEYNILRVSDGSSKLVGKVKMDGENPINSWVEKNIAPSHIFTNAIYVRQGEIDSIIKDDESRDRIIRKVTRIEDYENAWKNLGIIIRMFENDVENIRQFIVQESELESKRMEKEAELNEKKVELDNLRKRVEELRLELRELSKKKKELDEILERLNRLKIEAQKVQGEVNTLKSNLKNLMEQKSEIEEKIKVLTSDVSRLRELREPARRYEDLERIFKQISKSMNQLESDLSGAKVEVQNLTLQLKKIAEDKRRIKEIKTEISQISKEMETLQKYVEEWEKIKSALDRSKQIEEQIKGFGYDVDEIQDLFALLNKSRDDERRIQEGFKKIASRKSALIAKGLQIKNAINELKRAKGYCPTCGRSLDNSLKLKLIRDYVGKLKEIKEEITQLEEATKKLERKKEKIDQIIRNQDAILNLKQLKDELDDIKSQISRKEIDVIKEKSEKFDKLKEKIDKLQGELNALEKSTAKEAEIKESLKRLNERISEIKEHKSRLLNTLKEFGFNSLKEMEVEIENLKGAYLEWFRLKESSKELERERDNLSKVRRSIERLKGEIDEKSGELSTLQGKIEELEEVYDDKVHKEVEQEFIEKSNELEASRGKIELLCERVESLEKDIKYIQKQIELVREQKRKLDVIERRILPELAKIREKFRKYRNYLAETALREVESYASEIFQEFTEGKYLGIKLRQVMDRREKLKVFVLHQGKEREISFLSGGELIALGLAFRLALTMYMIRGKIPLLILDEPTPFLDEERRRKLVEITSNYLRKIPQVIIVSHDDELKDAADRVINVELMGGSSRVSYVEA